jgi:hypothetical protein
MQLNHRRLRSRFITIVVLIVIVLLRYQFSDRNAANGPNGQVANEQGASESPADASSNRDRTSTSGLPAERDTLEISPPRDTAGDASAASDSDTSEPYLAEIGRDAFRSPAGLVWGPGSVDRHRIQHVMKHRADDPSKPIHGVFEGSEREVLQLIDEAWRMTQKGGNAVQSQRQNNRTAYTVFLNRRIGYVGGQAGNRRGHPMCEYLKLVVEQENRIVTAYPVDKF